MRDMLRTDRGLVSWLTPLMEAAVCLDQNLAYLRAEFGSDSDIIARLQLWGFGAHGLGRSWKLGTGNMGYTRDLFSVAVVH